MTVFNVLRYISITYIFRLNSEWVCPKSIKPFAASSIFGIQHKALLPLGFDAGEDAAHRFGQTLQKVKKVLEHRLYFEGSVTELR